MGNRGSKTMALAALVVGVVGLTIGFAAFSTTLTINSSADIAATDAAFAGWIKTPTTAPACTTEGGATADKGTWSNGVWSGIKAHFTAPGQSITCTATVTNTSAYDAYLTTITIPNTSDVKVVTCTKGTATDVLVNGIDGKSGACASIKETITTGTTKGNAVVTTTGLTATPGTAALTKSTGTEVVTVKIEYPTGAQALDGSATIAIPDIMFNYSTAQ